MSDFPRNQPTVLYWLKTFIRYMQKKDNEGATAETIEKFAIYPKYVSNMLLQVALEKKDLVAFGESFAELRSSCGKLFPTQGLADAILAMSRFDSSKDVALEVEFLACGSPYPLGGEQAVRSIHGKHFRSPT